MTASTEPFVLRTANSERLPLRLQLNGIVGDGTQDGMWWPQTRDPVIELSDLVNNFPPDLGPVDRIFLATADWDSAPRRVRVHHGWLDVGTCRPDSTQQVLLSMSVGRAIALTVTPSEASPSVDDRTRPALGEPAGDIEDADPDAVLLWNDSGDTWWPEGGAPSYRA